MLTQIRFNILLIFSFIFSYILLNCYLSVKKDNLIKLNTYIDTGLFMSILLIISLTLFPLSNEITEQLTGEYYTNPQLNLVPFQTIKSFFNEWTTFVEALINLLGNILLFIPLGYFSYLKFNKRLLLSLLCILFSTLLVEFCQFYYPMRLSDIDDVILNTLGGLIGIIIAKINIFIVRWARKIKSNKQ